MKRVLVHAATLLGLTAVYFVAAKLGLSLAVVNPSASPVWPPTGISLAALLLIGPRVWPSIFAGAFLANVTTTGVAASLGIAVGNTLEGVLGAWLVTRFARGRHVFGRPQDVFKFVALAGLVSAVCATIGVTSLEGGGLATWSDYGPIWTTWWLGDAGGALVMTPALVCWFTSPWRCGRAKLLEAAALLAAIGGIGFVVFGGLLPAGRFLCMPLAIWAAFRFGPRETALVVLLVSAFAVWGAVHGGPFPYGDPNQSLLLLQVFMAVVSSTALSLNAVVSERRRALEALEWQALALVRSNAELVDFAHVISHDLKAPLRGISSLASWIVEDCKDLLPDESREHLRLLDQRTKRMSQLIDGVLDYSRIGRKGRVYEDVDARAVAEEVIDSLGPPASPSIRIEGRLPVVSYDRTQLTQVLQNLIENAVEHMGREGGEVVVSCRERRDAFEFAVRDNGLGIERRHLQSIFRMFHALHPERATTGVGLTIVKKIVELHGGSIAVESTPGVGTTFRFTVPKQPGGESSDLLAEAGSRAAHASSQSSQ